MKFSFLRTLVVSALMSTALVAQSNLGFDLTVDQPTNYIRALVIDNLVGSAADDIVMADPQSSVIFIRDMATTPPTNTVIGLGAYPLDMVTADFDGDGDRDIATVNGFTMFTGPTTVSICMNNGGGNFQITQTAIPYPSRLFVRDMNGDGDQDLVVGLTILENNGAGVFTAAPAIPTSTTVKVWAPGDFDGDGDVDLATSYYATVGGVGGTVVRLFRKEANGTWNLLAPISIVPNKNPGSFGAADVNGDGKDDLVYQTSAVPAAFAQIHLGTVLGGASFGANRTPEWTVCPGGLSADPGDIVLADMNGDGAKDVVAIDGDRNPLVFLNDGTGRFTPAGGPLFPSVAQTLIQTPAVGDIDQDGDPDVVIAVAQNIGVAPWILAVYRNQGAVPAANLPTLTAAVTAVTISEIQTLNWDVFMTRADGLAAVGQSVNFQAIPVSTVPAVATCFSPTVSTFLNAGVARATLVVNPTPPGIYVVTAQIPSGASVSVTVTVIPSIAITQGGGQSAAADTWFPARLGAHVAGVAGPVGGTLVVWTASPSGAVLFGTGASTIANTTTDLAGDVSIDVRAGAAAGPVTVTASWDGHAATLPLTVLPNHQLTIVAGDAQITNVEQAFSAPLALRLADAANAPLANTSVTYSVTQGQCTLAATNVLTDSQGIAVVAATAPQATLHRGAITVRATTVNGAVDFHLFARGLVDLAIGTTGRLFQYSHEHTGIPLLLMVDAPLPAPGFVSSFFGPLYTSVQAPLPTFVALDGWGAFGPPDPTLITNALGQWTRLYPNIPVLGLTLVAQMAAYDPAYPFPGVIVISNPVTFTL